MSRLEELHAQLVIASSIAENRGWLDIATELDRIARMLALKPRDAPGSVTQSGHIPVQGEVEPLRFTSH